MFNGITFRNMPVNIVISKSIGEEMIDIGIDRL